MVSCRCSGFICTKTACNEVYLIDLINGSCYWFLYVGQYCPQHADVSESEPRYFLCDNIAFVEWVNYEFEAMLRHTDGLSHKNGLFILMPKSDLLAIL